MHVCLCVARGVGAGGVESPGAGVTCSCQPANVGAEDWTWTLAESTAHSQLLSCYPAPRIRVSNQNSCMDSYRARKQAQSRIKFGSRTSSHGTPCLRALCIAPQSLCSRVCDEGPLCTMTSLPGKEGRKEGRVQLRWQSCVLHLRAGPSSTNQHFHR